MQYNNAAKISFHPFTRLGINDDVFKCHASDWTTLPDDASIDQFKSLSMAGTQYTKTIMQIIEVYFIKILLG